ncbi:hypothetical protein N3K66_006706 [Trichothecium roseum]|uniref:Uncharacterized protein n=1 Tax=Trichothecium roseum TaxID=47278 RepID=A0ACC0UW60_9HYPO|nr:hypothetical protein N3K66_006706 [Trichothecium roseum]
MADAAKDVSSTPRNAHHHHHHHHHQTSSTSTSSSRPSPQQQATTTVPTPRISVEDASSSSSQHLPPSSVDSSPRRRFKSYRLRAAYEKPWLRDPNVGSTRWNDLVVCVFVLLGLLGAGGIAFATVWPYRSGDYCLIYEDDFATLDPDVWTREVQLDGFGTGAFDWTTPASSPENAYVDAAGLHIVPTLTNETTSLTNAQLYANHTVDLGGDCTAADRNSSACVVTSDPDAGVMIPPVRSARLSTRGAKGIRYGRVEVVAKMPRGDWIWPAIWMMPEDSVYGEWPRSGEIDIMESRGNGAGYEEGGRNYYYSTLHWGKPTSSSLLLLLFLLLFLFLLPIYSTKYGKLTSNRSAGPDADSDAYWRTTSAKKLRRGDYADGFRTFGLQWTDRYMYFYVGSRVHQIFFMGFRPGRTLYRLGGFAGMADANGTLLADPWGGVTGSDTGNAPFDQRFYLVLNVAVGSRNGWFLDKVGGKPWTDDAANAQWAFWSAADDWLPTWGEGEDRGMTVRSVRMWQAGKCGATDEL